MSLNVLKSVSGSIKNYENEETRGFLDVFGNRDLKLVKLNISKVCLTINYQFDEPVEYVCAFMNIKYEGEVIGYYEFVFTLDGDDLDHYLR